MSDPEFDESVIESFIDQAVAAAKEAHGPGHAQEWYEAVGRRMIWYKAHGGDMSDCPVPIPDGS